MFGYSITIQVLFHMDIIGCVIPGAGAFEVAVHNSLLSSTFLKTVSGRARLGVQVLCYCMVL